MYKIKRFSCIEEKLYADLSLAREQLDNKNHVKNLVSHFILFMCTDCDTLNHWGHVEIPDMIDSLVSGFDDKKLMNKLDYNDIFDIYLRYKSFIKNSVKSKLDDEVRQINSPVRVSDCMRFLNDGFEDAFKEFLSALNDYKKSLCRVILNSNGDRDLIYGILIEIKSRV